MIQERARAGHDRLLNDSKTVAKWRAVPEANWKILHRSSFLARDLHSRRRRDLPFSPRPRRRLIASFSNAADSVCINLHAPATGTARVSQAKSNCRERERPLAPSWISIIWIRRSYIYTQHYALLLFAREWPATNSSRDEARMFGWEETLSVLTN